MDLNSSINYYDAVNPFPNLAYIKVSAIFFILLNLPLEFDRITNGSYAQA